MNKDSPVQTKIYLSRSLNSIIENATTPFPEHTTRHFHIFIPIYCNAFTVGESPNRAFPETWKNTKGWPEIKKALTQNVSSLSINVKDSGETGKLIGIKIKDVDLPKHSLIGAV